MLTACPGVGSGPYVYARFTAGKAEYEFEWDKSYWGQEIIKQSRKWLKKNGDKDGVYWERGRVNWAGKPRLFGRAHPKADRVDLAGQQGVYLLYDENRVVVYVGQAAKQSIGQRLAQHTSDRLTGRWQRFSWFGIRPVAEDGKLGSVKAVTITPKQLISTLEALLIEALEPRQNRAGSSYSGEEYIQANDPKL